MNTKITNDVHLQDYPGHYIRRLQQIAVAIFLQETEKFNLTPVQYAALETISHVPNIDQKTLARTIGQDTSTIGGVIDRLESRGLVQRNASESDRRVHLLSLTIAGDKALEEVFPLVVQAQERILGPLDSKDRAEFMRIIKMLVIGNNELSRAPRNPL
jgi:DNA-binding MarR family transcriptional regulator